MNVLLPNTVSEACEMMSSHRAPVPVAGGTDLFVHWPQRGSQWDGSLLDLSGLSELKPYSWTREVLKLGALTTYWDLIQDPLISAEFPLLHSAARQVGAVQIQTRGTWAGNIMNASPAADGVAVLLAYDARLLLRSIRGTEEIPLSEFYTGYKTMRRQPDQLLTEIHIPRARMEFQLFEKVGSRAAQAITKVGLAITRSENSWRVVTNSVAPTVCRCPTLESFLGGGSIAQGPEDLLEPVRLDISPIDDLRSSAQYRETVLTRLLYFGLKDECFSFA
jgi:CO/xanthine dehydrogenase FAD-binding subunit